MAIAAFTIAYVPCFVAPPLCAARGGASRAVDDNLGADGMGVLCGHHASLGGGASPATRGAVSARAQSLIERDIRVNAVAPGPVWTPTIPAPMSQARVERAGEQVLMGRAAHPDEIAPS